MEDDLLYRHFWSEGHDGLRDISIPLINRVNGEEELRIKEGQGEHFLHNSRSHNFDDNITIIEQIKWSDMVIERKKQICQAREIFWQSQLNTLQPNGLNKRMG